MRDLLLKSWDRKSFLTGLLLPFSWLFQLISKVRYWILKDQTPFSVPVIVVGNLSVGGTGKTPMVIWLAQLLKEKGYTPGIVLRGYKSKLATDQVMIVDDKCDPQIVGDEAVLLASKTHSPVAIGAHRKKAIELLLSKETNVDLVISDDGLQHYAMHRDIEIIVLGANRLGNGYCLPAGPLRENASRLKKADFIITQSDPKHNEWKGTRTLSEHVYKLNDHNQTKVLSHFKGQTVNAIAGIGNPTAYFNMLEEQGINVIAHAFTDHHGFEVKDFATLAEHPILMTEKDAVKCMQFNLPNAWVVPLEVTLPEAFIEQFLRRLNGQKITRHSCMPNLQTTPDLQKSE